MIEELQAGSACDCTKNISWKDQRLHCAVRRSLGKTLDVQSPQGRGHDTVLRPWSAMGASSVQVQTLKFVSCLTYSADLRAAAVPTATGADDCHAPERNVRNDEMGRWVWIGVADRAWSADHSQTRGRAVISCLSGQKY